MSHTGMFRAAAACVAAASILAGASLPARDGELRGALNLPDVREKLLAASSDPVGSTPEAFNAYITKELARWGKVIRDNNIRAE